MEDEIYRCFLELVIPRTPKPFAEYAARTMANAAIEKAVKMGKEVGLKPEEAIHRLLMSLKYGKEMPERGETIH
ncbi:hypothetical protein ACNSOB_02255 [Citrobacter braakii]|uniref:hypothetical protein n=1 Tax=Citrobacter braakii TaxID=57706 RepID=UPI003AB4E74E